VTTDDEDVNIRATAGDGDPARRSAADPAVSWHLVAHLECFWPSRRLDAFDGLCRAA